jgi:hypothetical protein
MSKRKNQIKNDFEIYESIRKDFGQVKPYTRIIQTKRDKEEKRNRKYKNNFIESEDYIDGDFEP